MKILTATNMYPNLYKPYSGIFIKGHVDILKENYGINSFVITGGGSNNKSFEILKKYLLFIIRIINSTFTKSFDLIHAHFAYPTGLLSLPAKWFRFKKLILTVHGSDINSVSKTNTLKFLLTKFVLNQSDRIIAVSPDLKNNIINKFGILEDKISVIDMGFDPNIFFPLEQVETKKRDSFKFLFVGRLINVKGIQVLLDAILCTTEKTDIDFNCQIIGSSDQENDYKRWVTDHSLQHIIEFSGIKTQHEIAEAMRQSDAVIIPSLEEGFGLVAIESFACGLPVIASNTGGLKKLVDHGKNGFLFKPGNHQELATQIINFMNGEIVIDKKQSIASSQGYVMNDKISEIYKIYQQLIHE